MTDISIIYNSPERWGKSSTMNAGTRFIVDIQHPAMKERANFISILDPMLSYDDFLEIHLERYGNFLCKNDGTVLTSNGKNGAGTPSFRCKKCKTRPSIYNTFELVLFRYIKIYKTFLMYYKGNSLRKCGELFGLGEGLLTEIKLHFPMGDYNKDGELAIIEHEKKKYAVVTIDAMYKGKKGLMVAKCGKKEIGVEANETTGEGLDRFFDEFEKEIKSEKYFIIMDVRWNVIKKILDRYGERAIIAAQNHTLWGDAYIYFNKDGTWYTLHLRTDTFTEVSKKRDEAKLLAPGEVELYEGIKGVSQTDTLRMLSNEKLEDISLELIEQLKNVNWEHEGRVDIVMEAKMQRLNGIIKEMEERKMNIEKEKELLRSVINGLIENYRKKPGIKIKKMIVRVWKPLKLLKDEVKKLEKELLHEELPIKNKKKPLKKKEPMGKEIWKSKDHLSRGSK